MTIYKYMYKRITESLLLSLFCMHAFLSFAFVDKMAFTMADSRVGSSPSRLVRSVGLKNDEALAAPDLRLSLC